MRHVIYLALALALGACGQTARDVEQAPAAPEPAAAPLALEKLEWAQTGGLSGELGCSFRAGEDMLLRAQGNVDDAARSAAVVSRNGAVTQLSATDVGGYDGMVRGGMFAGGGLTVVVQPGAENQTGTEEVSHAATLTARSGGEERSYAGVWTCGP